MSDRGQTDLASVLHLHYGLTMCPAGLNHNDFGDCPAQKYWLAEATSILGWDSVFLPDGLPETFDMIVHMIAQRDATIAVLRAALATSKEIKDDTVQL
jgi:hypothetical protein